MSDPKDHPYVGKKVMYRPPDCMKRDYGHKDTEGIVTMFEGAGHIFNQPMCCIDTVDCWIPWTSCTVDGEPEKKSSITITLG